MPNTDDLYQELHTNLVTLQEHLSDGATSGREVGDWREMPVSLRTLDKLVWDILYAFDKIFPDTSEEDDVRIDRAPADASYLTEEGRLTDEYLTTASVVYGTVSEIEHALNYWSESTETGGCAIRVPSHELWRWITTLSNGARELQRLHERIKKARAAAATVSDAH